MYRPALNHGLSVMLAADRKGIVPMKLWPLTPLLSSSGFHFDSAVLSPGLMPRQVL